jgi:hypothetical protein
VKPYYQDEHITLYCADARDVLDDLVFDVLLTDPPFGVDGGRGGDSKKYQKANYDLKGWQDNGEYISQVVVPIVERVLSRIKRGAITPGVRWLHLYPQADDMGCFWQPAALTHGPWGFTTFSPILYYGKDHRAGKGALPTGCVSTEAPEENGHPCPKPIKVWRWLLNKVADVDDVVLDPFVGSGTTLRAAKDLNRRAIGIEINEAYCEIAVQRLAQTVMPLGV